MINCIRGVFWVNETSKSEYSNTEILEYSNFRPQPYFRHSVDFIIILTRHVWNILISRALNYTTLVAGLIWCYKIVFVLVDVDVNEFFVLIPHTRGHVYKLNKAYNSCIRSSFFNKTVINVWNSLPAGMDFSSVNSFKSGIQCADFTQFLKRCL